MNTNKSITRAVIIFTALSIAGISVAVNAQVVQTAIAQSVMVAIGSTIFGAGLTFFLIRMTDLLDN